MTAIVLAISFVAFAFRYNVAGIIFLNAAIWTALYEVFTWL